MYKFTKRFVLLIAMLLVTIQSGLAATSYDYEEEIDGVTASFTFNKEGTTMALNLVKLSGGKVEYFDVPAKVSTGWKIVSVSLNEYAGSIKSITIPNGVESLKLTRCKSITNVEIPNSVTSIGDYAFIGCESLTSVNIPNSVTSIGRDAFNGCTSLREVIFEDGNSSITLDMQCKYGKGIFWYCPLEYIYIGRNIQYIQDSYTSLNCGPSAFYNKGTLTEVVLGDSVTNIPDYLFSNCKNLESITISKNLESIGTSAFSECSNLKKVNYDGSISSWMNINFSNKFSTPFSYGGHWYNNDTEVTGLVIPDSITYIGKYVFYGFEGIESVSFSKNVITIDDNAFGNCDGLKKVDYRGSLSDWLDIEFVSYTSNPLSQAGHLYINGNEIKKLIIPENVTSIGNFSFYGCKDLTSVTIPFNVKTIGNGSFCNCDSIKLLNLSSGVTSIGSSAFGHCEGISSLTIPSSVTTIESGAFSYCKNITEVIVEDGEESLVCNTSFSESPVKYVYLGRNIEYDKSTFKYDKSPFYNILTMLNVTIGSKVSKLPSGLFNGCSNLRSIIIPSSVISIEDYAFPSVTKVFFFTNTAPSIERHSFENCKVYYTANDNSYSNMPGLSTRKVYSLLSSMFEVDGVKYIPTSMNQRTCDVVDVNYSLDYVNSIIGPIVKYTNGNGREYDFAVNNITMYAGAFCNSFADLELKNEGLVEDYAFYKSNISSVFVDSTVSTIGDYSFSGCLSLRSISISNNGNIGKYAFNDCNVVSDIIVSNNGNVGEYAFSNCVAVSNILVSNNGNIGKAAFIDCMSTNEGQIYISNKGDVGDNAFSNCTKASVVEINNTGTLGENAFEGNIGAKDIRLGDDITAIGKKCFYNCDSIECVNFGKKILSIGDYAFANCTSIKTVKFNKGLKSIGWYAFDECSNIVSLSIPASVNEIGMGAFRTCLSLEELSLEDGKGIIKIGGNIPNVKNLYIGRNFTYTGYNENRKSVFSENDNLEKVVTSMSVINIPDYAFYNCKKLKDVYLSDAVCTIGKYAFSGDLALASFEVGVSVKNIGAEAFSDCSGLLNFVSHSTIPAEVGTEALDDINKLECTLHVPQVAEIDYKKADQWKDFWIENDLPLRHKVIVSVDPKCEGMGTVSGSNGYNNGDIATLEANTDEWHRFVEWSDGNKENPRTLTITDSLIIFAKFEYIYNISSQPSENSISVSLNDSVPGVEYKWYSLDLKEDITSDLQSSGDYPWEFYTTSWGAGNKGVFNSSSTLNIILHAKAGNKLSFHYSVTCGVRDYLKVYLDDTQIGRSYNGYPEIGDYEYTFESDTVTMLRFVYSKGQAGYNSGLDAASISDVKFDGLINNTLLNDCTSNVILESLLEKGKYYYCDIVMPDGTILTTDIVKFSGGLDVPNISANNNSPKGIYDIMGRKLKTPQRGINLIDGKKVFVK